MLIYTTEKYDPLGIFEITDTTVRCVLEHLQQREWRHEKLRHLNGAAFFLNDVVCDKLSLHVMKIPISPSHSTSS